VADLLQELMHCIERGKINAASPYPPDMKGQDGADELTKRVLEAGTPPEDILSKALIVGMNHVGTKFAKNEVFVPDLLMSAKAMSTAMVHLKPFFESGQAKHQGTFVVGTVQGDLHDIGKKLVAMVMEGGGWEVIDLGVDVSPDKFLDAIEKHPNAVVGLSALLTTTMVNMERTVKLIKEKYPETRILIGGAPVTEDFRVQIGADGYSPDPQSALDMLTVSSP
jgi:5-methyltetrahydrofolate--homocysteine methyltransferase